MGSEALTEKLSTLSLMASEAVTEKLLTLTLTASEAANEKMLTLLSSDGTEFLVEERVAVVSVTLKNMVDSDCSAADRIPLPKIDAATLSLVIEYCKPHAAANQSDEQLKSFDDQFLEQKSLSVMLNLVLAANFLEIKGLLEILYVKIADFIKEKPHQEVREIFNVENDYTPEEEAAVRAEHEWAFDGFP